MPSKELKVLSAQWAEVPTPIGDASASREGCVACGLYKTCRDPFQRVLKPNLWNGKALAIMDGPGDDAKALFRASGFGVNDVAYVGAVRCATRRGTPKMSQIRACRPFLIDAISKMKPELVFAFGSTAAKAVCNAGTATVGKLRGRELRLPSYVEAPVIVTYAPSSVEFGGLQFKERIVEDLKHATQAILPWPVESCPKGHVLGLDTEFTDDRVLDVGLANENVGTTLELASSQLRRVLAACERPVCHSLVDIDSLVSLGLAKETWVQGRSVRDSLLLARMADENRGKGGYELESLFLSIYRSRAWKYKTEQYSKHDPLKWPVELRQERCRIDAWAGLMVAKHFWKLAKGPIELAHRIAMTLQRVYHTRAYIDLKAFEAFAEENTAATTTAADLVRRVGRQHGMTEFEPHNQGHLRTLLYDKLKLPVPMKTKGGLPSTGKIALKMLAGKHPVIEHITAFSKVRKLQTTYVEGLRERFAMDKDRPYLRVRVNPLGARTGRRSSGANPLTGDDNGSYINFQNFPKAVRPMIVSRWKGGLIADDDYSKLEIILHGLISGETAIVEYFTESPNGYIAVGKRLFKKTVKEDTSDYRVVKAVLLGIQYNMSPWELARQLWTVVGVKFSEDWNEHVKQTETVHRQYLAMFPRLKDYMLRQEQTLRQNGFIEGWLGQRRRLALSPEPPRSEQAAWKMWRRDYKHKVNEAINFPTQWAASLVTGTAMLDVEERLLSLYGMTYVEYHEALMRKEWPRFALLINEVHDDLVYDLYPKTWKKDADLIYETMKELKTLRALVPLMRDCPINVGQKVGANWGSSDKLKR